MKLPEMSLRSNRTSFLLFVFTAFTLTFTVSGFVDARTVKAESAAEAEALLKGLQPGEQVPTWAQDMHIRFAAPPGAISPTDLAQSDQSLQEPDSSGTNSALVETQLNPYRFNGGWVQHRPHVHVVFWGSEWNSFSAERTAVLDMFRWISGSSYANILTQYFDYSGYIGNEVDLTSYTDTRSSHPTGVTIGSIEQEISYSIGSQAGWAPTSVDDQYMVITAPGTTFTNAFVEANNCGFHGYPNNSFGAPFSFVAFPAGQFEACSGGMTSAASLQAGASHEWVETVTDPVPPKSLNGALVGWFRENASAEIGDGCGATHPPSAPAGIVVERLHDNYLAAATGQFCTAQDASPIRYSVKTNSATEVSAATKSAVLRGEVTPAGYPATYQFSVSGPSGSSNLPASPQGLGSGFAPVSTSQTLSGLKGSSTYSFSIQGTSQLTESLFNGKTSVISGGSMTFTTPDWRPAISYQPATGRTTSSATLNAKINPQGEATTYHFEWGETTSYGNSGPVPDASIGSGTSDVAVSRALSGLKPETTYHFRVVAKNGEGTKIGPDATVTTMANTPAYASSFGAGGAGDGQFSRPLAMAADAPGGFPSGDVWVVDKLNNRVEKFNSKGQFVSKFGSFGTGNGQFNEPRAITVDGQGNLWVADAGNNRIQQFNSKGEYLGQIKSGLVLKSIDIPSGLAIGRENHIFVANQGSGGTIFELLAVPTGGPYVTAYWDTTTTPANMATDPQGDVWVVDTAENKLYEVPSSGGGPVARFGTTGTAPGQLSAPYAVAVKPSGTLLVSDRGNNRIQQFSQTGELLASFGKGGNEPGEFCEPSGLALSSRGVVFVADACHDKVQRWNQKTAPEAITQPATSVAATSATLNARINPSGLATSYHFDYGKTTAYGTWAPASSGVLGASFEDATVTATITGLVPDTIYHRRIAAMNAEGTTFGKDHTFVTPSGTAAYASSFSSLGPEGGSLNRPLGMAAEVIGGVATGNLWIVDNKNNRVVKVNSEGGYIRHVGSFGTANGQFDSPRGVAVDDQGNIWVTDAGNHRVQKFNAKGEFLMRIRSLDVDGSSALETPSGIAIGREGHLFVGDQGLGGVILELSTTQGSNGRYAAWQYTNATNPTQLATDEDGDVWVIDYQDNKVYEVPESGGAPVVRFGTGGTGPGQLTGPYGIAVKPNGNILISNRGNNLIQQFSPWGAYQFQFGAPGTGPGQFSEPSQMVVGPDGSVYVADSGNNRVQRWTFK